MGMGPPNKPAQVRSDINVTPLVDVVLVLLIIFMVVTPMLQSGKPVRLPLTMEPSKKPEDAKQLLISITDKNEVFLGNDRMLENNFAPALDEAFERNPGASVNIKADGRLTYGEVKKVMARIQKAGLKNVGLITLKKDVARTSS